ncbi:hypothetical protein CHLRE_12g541600v5 [Chlamydomonas reinhardtii]|uniref:Ysc84 actin-binding domain-containing protein n=1 Tax=Chlamydomonas reinhardtii TaxID=3055 RepID=A8IYW5_CHLRE|nr:uncharacterized protein CHLRE_12g541600v5 [Chlamydomonas reinhardtii]PNW76262.1 hypothetical protein CHLRE_12g541600v5 [Chlamydomonas reinhardtii]|eukprot:XP_001693913.1 predicted protein [Chlamydomonas reinhardtii]
MKIDKALEHAVKAVGAVQDAVKAGRVHAPPVPVADELKGFLVLHSVKGAALVGFERGYGLAFSVLEWLPDGAPKLSAPLIVKVSKLAVGMAIGYNEVFSVALLRDLSPLEAVAEGSETIMGKDFDLSGLSKPLEGDLSGTNFHKTSMTAYVDEGKSANAHVLSVSDSMMLCDLSLYGGSMSVDKDLMDEAYGGVYGSNRDVLRGRVEVPAGLQPAMGGITAGLRSIVREALQAHEKLNPKIEKAKEVAKDLINYK